MGWFDRGDLGELLKAVERMAEGEYDTRMPTNLEGDEGRLAEILGTFGSHIHSEIQNLSSEKSRLSTVLANMTEGVVAVDQKGQILVVNPSLCQLFSLNPWDVKGKPFLEVIRQSGLSALLDSVLKQAQPQTTEVKAFSPDERVFEAIAVPLLEEGRSRGALLVLHDITNLRRLEQIRRDFVANVSHELRTPLASIKGMAETLRAGALDDPQVRLEFLESIEKQTDNMTALVQDLLDLAAIEAGQRPPRKAAVDLPVIIEDVVKNLSPLAKKRKVDVQAQLPPVLPELQADSEQLKQILINIVENAIKFNRESGSVFIKAKTAAKSMAITVEDTGPGIPTQDLPRIFERFYRVDKARSREMGGTGLGLSIVKHIAEAHGGTVSVESTVGKGSVFTVLLPL